MAVSILVPIDNGPDRVANWEWLRRRYEQWLGWPVVPGSAPAAQWSKGRALESAARRVAGDVFVIVDADSWVAPAVLRTAVGMVAAGAPWVVPHAEVRRLNPTSTVMLLKGQVAIEDLTPKHRARVHRSVVGGGAVVLSRQAYREVGGIDERFQEWGGEDVAFGCALDTLVGRHVQLDAVLWHLWHPDQEYRRRSPNEELGGEYLMANGDERRMRQLVTDGLFTALW